jgi:chemotaxis protein CheX
MEKDYYLPFIIACKNVCENFLMLNAEYENPSFVEREKMPPNDISGIITLGGDVTGLVMVSFKKEVISKIVSKMINKEITEIDENVMDIVGETANIIAGNAKEKLEKYKIIISLPIVVTGKNHFVKQFNEATEKILEIPFKTSEGNFSLYLDFKTN